MLIPHLDVEATACELERRLRVAEALRAAELGLGPTANLPRAKRSLDVPAQVHRLIGRLHHVLSVSPSPVEPAVIAPSGAGSDYR
jgi:hypothetical protein